MTAAIMTAVTFIPIVWLVELGLVLDSDVVVSDCLSCEEADTRSRSNVFEIVSEKFLWEKMRSDG